MPLHNWEDVQRQAEEIMAAAPFEEETVANTRDLLAMCKKLCPLPDSLNKGYWNTLCLHWNAFELEVCTDHIEVYRYRENAPAEIWYEDHAAGQEFSAKFVEELLRLPSNLPSS